MSYFVLTELLRPRLGAGGRIVSTASTAHRGTHLDFDDLQSEKRYSGFSILAAPSSATSSSRAGELARRLGGTGVTANSLHPGFVAIRVSAMQELAGCSRSRWDWRRISRYRGAGREHNHLSRLVTRRRKHDRPLLRQVQAGDALTRSAERCGCEAPVGHLRKDRRTWRLARCATIGDLIPRNFRAIPALVSPAYSNRRTMQIVKIFSALLIAAMRRKR